ncbi:MAG: alpha/beta hydrolase [Burkholderiaceae bacterium]
MTTYVVAHGAWSSGFAWKRMHPLMRERGHSLFTPSLTGLGERFHQTSPSVDLEMHIRDVCNVLFHEDLHDVVLIGHSYGGMVATGVADHMPERLRKVIYLDAFVPRDGESLFDRLSPAARENMLRGAAEQGEGWRVPCTPLPADTPAEDVAWIMPRRHPQPIETVRQRLHLRNGETRLPRHYIYCLSPMLGDVFGQFAERARSEPGWGYDEIQASHNPHITVPETLADMLDRIAAE